MLNRTIFLYLLFVFSAFSNFGHVLAQDAEEISRQERLRGSVTPERAWWDLRHYDLSVAVDPEQQTIVGSNLLRFTVLRPASKMQIDLQEPLEISKVLWNEQELDFAREGNVYWIVFPEVIEKGTQQHIAIYYAGKPVVSENPPWSGGFSWQKDEKGKHFIATSCQGIGASIWWPCKDHGYDEPDEGMDMHFTVPQDLVAVSNGRLIERTEDEQSKTKTFHWRVTNPINNYCVNANIGNYIELKDTFEGEGGTLDLSYWVLEHQRSTAKRHFREVPRTLAAFEHWFGKYPFYEDSYKLVVVPYLGMEHQSSVTYGNGFTNGYKGTDLSGTGVGMQFDFIIVHESGHEWFGNNISMKDVADMWIHESFTNYSENLFVEFHFSEDEAQQYVIGCRKRVANDRPIIGTYNANRSGSKDMYYKGGNMLHTMRHIVNDDQKWRSVLRGLNEKFWHQIVTTEQIETFLIEETGIDFSKFFDQYLRSEKIPKFVYSIDGKKLHYHFEEVVEGFSMPVKVRIDGQQRWLEVSKELQLIEVDETILKFEVDRNFYVDVNQVAKDTK